MSVAKFSIIVHVTTVLPRMRQKQYINTVLLLGGRSLLHSGLLHLVAVDCCGRMLYSTQGNEHPAKTNVAHFNKMSVHSIAVVHFRTNASGATSQII